MNNADYDSLEYRKKIWEKEYQERKALPSSNTLNPSSSLRRFIEKYPNLVKDSALDLGCGNGRNSVYLLQHGYKKVLAIDLSETAIGIAKKEQRNNPKQGAIEYIAKDIADALDSVDQKFDLIIDMTVLHSLTLDTRIKTISHIKRLLKPNGHYLIFTLMANSPAVIELKRKNPGVEPNSYRFEYAGDVITEKAFTLEELKMSFAPLELIEFEEYQTVTKAFSGEFSRIYLTCLFKKKR
ncbi:class I SAM-dependent methyltransferase [bacterium]|nr:class I SAM-dependent methyltransferase [bacterium]